MSRTQETIIRATPQHVRQLCRLIHIRDECAPEPRHIEQLLNVEGRDSEEVFWLGIDDGSPYGFARLSPMQDEEMASAHVFALEFFTLPGKTHLAADLLNGVKRQVKLRCAASGVSLFCLTGDGLSLTPLAAAGFSLAPPLPSLLKPLKPLRMLTARRGLGRLGQLVSLAPDTLFHSALSVTHRALSSGLSFVDCSAEGSWLNPLAQMIQASGEGQLMRRWTPTALNVRLNFPSLQPYVVMAAARGPSIVAIVISRMYNAPTGERIALILDAVHTPAGLDAIGPLLTRHEKSALVHGADAMFALAPRYQALNDVFQEMGYLAEIAPSIHHVLNWSTISSDRVALSRCRLSLLDFDGI